MIPTNPARLFMRPCMVPFFFAACARLKWICSGPARVGGRGGDPGRVGEGVRLTSVAPGGSEGLGPGSIRARSRLNRGTPGLGGAVALWEVSWVSAVPCGEYGRSRKARS